MNRRQMGWLVFGMILLAALVAGPVTAGAQTPPSLPEAYTWQPYGLSVRYPDTWTVYAAEALVSLHPTDRDVSDGQGPELILFTLPDTSADQLDALIGSYLSVVQGTTTAVQSGILGGYPTRSFTFDSFNPDTVGGVMLIAVGGTELAGAAYTVRDSEASTFLPVMEAMVTSLAFDAPVDMLAGFGSRSLQGYTDGVFGYALQYPNSWELLAQEKPGEISLHPLNEDISAGDGPELVIVVLDTLPAGITPPEVMDRVIAGRPGEFSTPQVGTLDGHATLLVTYTNATRTPAVQGLVYLVQVSDSQFLALGYRAPDTKFAAYEAVFETIRTSFHLPSAGPAAAVPGDVLAISSASVASIQLPQRYEWAETGLALYFPNGWTIQLENQPDGALLTASPPPDEEAAGLIQGTTLASFSGMNLRDLVDALGGTSDIDRTVVETTVAGYPAVIYDMTDTSDEPALHVRGVLVSLEDRQVIALFLLGTPAATWDEVRPLSDAFISSIEPLDRSLSLLVPDAPQPIRALLSAPWPGTPLPRWQSGSTPYDWEEFGIMFDLPENWQTFPASQDYDLALVSPEAAAGADGAFLTFRYVPVIGPDTALESALQPLADQFGGEVTAYTQGDAQGAEVKFTDGQTGAAHHLILIPYGTHGETLYIQTTAAPEQDEIILNILQTMVITPPVPDADAINAAWQQSLAADRTLGYGSADAPVSMVEYLDFSCSHCAEYSFGMGRLMALDVEPGRLHVEFALLDIIGGELSNTAAQAMLCATEQGKGYSAYKALWLGYFNQGRETAYTREGITDLLGTDEIGLNMDALNACLDAGTYADVIQSANSRALEVGVNSTPSVLLAVGSDVPVFLTLPDGQPWTGGIPVSALRDVLDRVINDGVPLEDALKN